MKSKSLPAGKINLDVKGTTIAVVSQKGDDYICVTDIARYKDNERTDYIIQNWLRNRNTIEFLGIWEQLNNPDFNPIGFDGIRNQAGLNSFILTAKRWIESTGAIGLISKPGRYGGTYAHKDIAFEFASWVSVEFKLYLIKEFQRLKEKALSTTCQMTVICAGTPAVVADFQADPQLERRFSITQLEKWKPGVALDRFLATYERARPLRRPSRLNTPTLVAALLAETGGTTHSIMQALNSAAIVAIHDGIEHITPELLTVQRTDPARLLRAKLSARAAAAVAAVENEPEERAEVAA